MNEAAYWWTRIVYELAGVAARMQRSGSGDTFAAYVAEVVVLIVSVVSTIIWSIIDRRRGNYTVLSSWLRVLARYALAYILFAYAFSKIIPTQFLPPQDSQLSEVYGRASPMGLLWRFMGFSTAYTIFGGLAELLPAILLLFRRTAMLGSVLGFLVMLNIVMLNLCYDVPVKLASINLLFLCGFLILPDVSRLYRFFVLNVPTQRSALAEPILHDRTFKRVGLVLKYTALGIFLTLTIKASIVRYRQQRESLGSPGRYPLTSRGFHWVQEYPYNR